MFLQNLSDEQLHTNTLALVKYERETLSKILHHLMENYRRRLFSKHRLPSLHAYAVSLGYSDNEAATRITAMRLLRECPAIEEKIASAELNLTHVLTASAFFHTEKKAGREFTTEKKEEVFEAMAGLPVREAAKVAQTFSPDPAPLGVLLKLRISEEAHANLKRLKGLRAHADGPLSDAELFEKLLAEDIARRTAEPKKPRQESKAEMHREVARRDDHKCTNCGSEYALEEDHRIAQALGGPDTSDNLRLLCRSCNQRAAIETFGQRKMDLHINQKPAAQRVSDSARL